MQVKLAGYNIDSSLIEKLNNPAATPEVISAAYARISRSEKSVTQLRAEALQELAKSRQSNQKIIFKLGHASVAEHAVFNFDVLGISRFLTETLETLRLASFTEKSQRYVTFTKDYVVPAELDAPLHGKLKGEYIQVLDALFAEYKASFEALAKRYAAEYPDMKIRDRECLAKEDARYILPLATKTQLGMTLNARSLENLLRRLASSPYYEADQLRSLLLSSVEKICPSLVRYTEAGEFKGTFSTKGLYPGNDGFKPDETVRIVSAPSQPDDMILAALLYEQTAADFSKCRKKVGNLSDSDKRDLWKQFFAGIQVWDKMPRAFELIDFTFELRLSESCWAQLKRHRMGTFIKQQAASGQYVLPGAIQDVDRLEHWDALADRVEELGSRLRKIAPDLSPYLRLNASKVKVLAKMNLREIYHFIRLRADEHAQWEINVLAHELERAVSSFAPHASAFLCGKSELPSLADVFGGQKD